MPIEKMAIRCRYGDEFKAQVIAECDVAGASVVKLAMSQGINTQVVHGWRKLARNAGHFSGGQRSSELGCQAADVRKNLDSARSCHGQWSAAWGSNWLRSRWRLRSG